MSIKGDTLKDTLLTTLFSEIDSGMRFATLRQPLLLYTPSARESVALVRVALCIVWKVLRVQVTSLVFTLIWGMAPGCHLWEPVTLLALPR